MKGLKLVLVLLVALTAVAGIWLFLLSASNPPVQEPREVSLRMPYAPASYWAPFLLAEEKGYYAEEGLKVKLHPSQGSSATVKSVASRSDEFGMASGSTILIGKSQDMPLKSIGVIYQESASMIIYSKKSGIESPKDLEGRIIGSNPQGAMYQELAAFAGANNIDLAKTKIVPLTSIPLLVQALLSGEIDGYTSSWPKGNLVLGARGYHEFDTMLFSEHGFHTYDQTLFTSEGLLRDDPKLAGGFMRATLRGWKFSMQHPQEAIDILLRNYPELASEDMLEEFVLRNELTENEVTRQNGFGFMLGSRWEEMQEALLRFGTIDERIDVESLYTNEFLEEAKI